MAKAVCNRCGKECPDPCLPLSLLIEIHNEQRLVEKKELIANLRSQLNLLDAEPAEDLKELAEKIIRAVPDLQYINEFGIKVGYVRSYESKKGAKTVFADCRKLHMIYQAFLPFDFIITFYHNEASTLTENQQKILMLHELKHIGIGERGLRIESHDVEDFRDILQRYGIDWNGFNQDVPDILAGGDDGETKGDKMEAKRKTGGNGRTPSKPRGQTNKN